MFDPNVDLVHLVIALQKIVEIVDAERYEGTPMFPDEANTDVTKELAGLLEVVRNIAKTELIMHEKRRSD